MATYKTSLLGDGEGGEPVTKEVRRVEEDKASINISRNHTAPTSLSLNANDISVGDVNRIHFLRIYICF